MANSANPPRSSSSNDLHDQENPPRRLARSFSLGEGIDNAQSLDSAKVPLVAHDQFTVRF